MNAEYITKTQLKETRGWTDAAIKKFLGEEDNNTKNTAYRNASPVCLYLLERVQKAESTQEFEQWRKLSQKRRESAIKAADVIRRQRQIEREQAAILEENLRRELLEYQYHQLKNALNEVCLTFKPLSHRELVKFTCECWVKEHLNIEPSNARLEELVIPFAELIRPFGVNHAKQFLALAERICDVLESYNTTEPVSENRYEQITLLESLCKECQKVIIDCKTHGSKKEYTALKKPFNLHELTNIMGRRNANTLSNYLYHFVEVVANGREIVSVKGSGSIVAFSRLIEQQIFSIHADELQAVQIKLNAIATSDEYKDLIAEYDTRKWAQQRYEDLLANAYPTIFNKSAKLF